MRVGRGVLAVLVAVGLGACEPGGVQLDTDRARYLSGELVALELFNGGATTVEYNLCLSELERQAADAWVRLAWEDWHRPDEACPLVAHTLRPGARSSPLQVGTPSGLPTGTYRFVTRTSDDAGERREVVGDTFTVTLP